MTKKIVNQVQDFLTVVGPDHTYQIANVGLLLWRHTPEQVVGFLNQLRQEYKKELRELLRENKTHPKVNYLVVHTRAAAMGGIAGGEQFSVAEGGR